MKLFHREATPSAERGRSAGPFAAGGASWRSAAAPFAAVMRMVALGCARLMAGCAMLMVGCAMLMVGCASPGPPRSPSLRLPEPVTDLAARRVGDGVEVQFTAPSRSTDKLPLRAQRLKGVLCRAVEHKACLPVAGFAGGDAIAPSGPDGGRNVVTWRDPLPAGLVSGAPRLLSYRVEFFNNAGRSAGMSEAAYTAAGAAPEPVEGLRAEGSRLGVVLGWRGTPGGDGTVLLRRENLAPAAGGAGGADGAAERPKTVAAPRRSHANRGAAAPKGRKTEAAVVWLDAGAAAGPNGVRPQRAGSDVLDDTARPDVPYRYTAVRQMTVTLGGRSIELRSAASMPVEFTLREIYAPPAPTGLTAAGYATSAGQAPSGGGFAVDLIWQPVDATGLIAPLMGYNVYRATLNAGGRLGTGGEAANHRGERLNAELVQLPAFHDTTADPAKAYRYAVTAVDSKGNESGAATTELQPSTGP